MSDILIVGSIGFDFVFDIHGSIKDKILIRDGEVHSLDLLFTAKDLSKRFGGTAGNIAYGLGLLKKPAKVFSVVGEDYESDYKPYLENLGIIDHAAILEGGHTAAYYAASDEEKNLLGVWQPNAHEHIHSYKLSDHVSGMGKVKYAIFSPGTSQSITNHIKEFKKLNRSALAVFDPGQITNFFQDDLLKECLNQANIVIGNEVEIPLILKKAGTTLKRLSKTCAIVNTLGSKGCKIYHRGTEIQIDIDPAENIIEATGAGDAFRAGFLYGLSHGLSFENAAKVGNILGKINVQTQGGQGYEIDKKSLKGIKKLLGKE